MRKTGLQCRKIFFALIRNTALKNMEMNITACIAKNRRHRNAGQLGKIIVERIRNMNCIQPKSPQSNAITENS